MSPADPQSSCPILEITSPQGQVTQFELNRSPLIIGRLAECNIQLDSPRVSRRHAQLTRAADGWIIRDLESRNHVRVNGQIVTQRKIEDCDEIEIGQFKLRILPAENELADNDSQTTDWSVDDTDATEFRMLMSSPAQRLNAAHLARVNALGQRLLEIPNGRQRLVEVCQALVGADMSCNSAVAVRIARSVEAQPQLLCPYQLRHGQTHMPGISRAVVEAVVAGQQPILAGGAVSSGLTVSFSEAERGVTAIMACPLHVDAAAADILYTTVPHDCGTLDWLALLALAGEQYKKAELQIEARQTSRNNAAIQGELQRARKIQMSLVPRNPTAAGLEVAIGFEPCLWIGGDYANVLSTPDGRVGLIVADVSGKGLSAAMVATGVHSVIDASISQGQSFAEMAEDLNRFLINSMDRQSHLTILAVLFDPRSGHLEYLNAGHPPIMIANRSGQVRDLNFGHNPPLGVLPTSPTIDNDKLEPGELLFMYTDGLTEMYDADGRMLGLAGVQSQIGALYAANADIPLSQLRDELSEHLDTLRGGSPVTDDRTFLLARRL
jgi:phosphoserine phosphatase RsbU/P